VGVLGIATASYSDLIATVLSLATEVLIVVFVIRIGSATAVFVLDFLNASVVIDVKIRRVLLFSDVVRFGWRK